MSELRIVSFSSTPFRDRVQAGQMLGQELSNLRGRGAVVLGIPRGGMVVAREVAEALDADLDVVFSAKLRTPGHQELALGAVSENGHLFLNEELVRELGISRTYIDEEKARRLADLVRRAEPIRRVLPKIPLEGRLAVITDDGVATGATTQAALWSVRQEHPEKLIAALPVGPEDTVAMLARDVDEMICLRAPSPFYAVGQFYLRFEQISDEDVVQIVEEERQRKAHNGA